MADKTEVEKKVEAIINDIGVYTKDTVALKTLKGKLDVLLAKPEEKDSNSDKLEASKDFYQLFFAVILGATGADLIHSFIVNYQQNWANYQNWVLLAIIIVYLYVGSRVAVFLSYKLPKWRRKKKGV